MALGKDINSGTQVHLTTVYKRNKGKKIRPKRVFNFVISGLLISSTLVGAVLGNGTFAEAAKDSTPVAQTMAVTNNFSDEEAMVYNLKMATNALQLAISRGNLDIEFYDTVMNNLLLIDGKINVDGKFSVIQDLETVLVSTDKALNEEITTSDKSIIATRDAGLRALKGVQDSLIREKSVGFSNIKNVPTKVVKMDSSKSQASSYKASAVKASYKSIDTKKASSYADYKSDQYWSSGMSWAVSKGYINTYVNKAHPSTGKTGNWLNPAGGLSEGQMLVMLTKYKYGTEYNKTKATSGVSYSVAYKIADKHKLTTKATHSKNRSYASKTMTRGQYAQILASAHYGKKVDLKTAVAFMYKSKITQGDKGSNGKYAKTYDSFGVNTKVSRAYGVYMLKNYSTFRASAHPASVSSIKTLYGGHTYGSRNQAEYDAVIGVAKKALKGVSERPFAQSPEIERGYMDYFDGAKPILDRSSPNYRTDYNMALLYAQSELKFYKESGMSKEDIIKYWQVKGVFSDLNRGIDPEDGSPSSAYDALFRGVTDCDADSQVMIMILDMMGYNVAILGRPGHAFTVVKLAGEWRNATTFGKVTMSPYIDGTNGDRVIVQPTKGY